MSVDTSLPIAGEGGCCDPGQLAPLAADRASDLAAVARALADPVRVQLLALLRQRPAAEVCQCELQPFLDISQPTLSHHLRKLQEAGLVQVERRGRWAYYSIDPDRTEVLRRWLS